METEKVYAMLFFETEKLEFVKSTYFKKERDRFKFCVNAKN